LKEVRRQKTGTFSGRHRKKPILEKEKEINKERPHKKLDDPCFKLRSRGEKEKGEDQFRWGEPASENSVKKDEYQRGKGLVTFDPKRAGRRQRDDALTSIRGLATEG